MIQEKAAIPPAMSGPTGIPFRKTIPIIDPTSSPRITWGWLSSKFNPMPFSLVAAMPPAIASNPGGNKVRRISFHSYFINARGTRTAIIRKSRPTSTPCSSRIGSRLFMFNTLISNNIPAAIVSESEPAANPRKKIMRIKMNPFNQSLSRI